MKIDMPLNKETQKKKLPSRRFSCASQSQGKSKKGRKAGEIPGPCQRAEKAVEILIVVGALGTIPKNLKKRLDELKNRERHN